MKRQTPLARTIDMTQYKSQYDAACKKLLGNRYVLAWILKTTVEEFKEYSIQDIAEAYIEGIPSASHHQPVTAEVPNGSIKGITGESTEPEEGTVTYDVHFHAVYPGKKVYPVQDEKIFAKIYVNVEAQKDFYPGYFIPKRGVFYCCRMISAQYNRDFVPPHYNDIKKVYSIWICMNPPKKAANTITKYQMRKEDFVGMTEDIPESYDLLSVIMICTGGSQSSDSGGILRMLDVLLSERRSAAEKKRILETDYGIKMSEEEKEEVDKMCNLSELVYERGMEAGRESGLEEGRRNGLAEGMEQKTMQIIRNMLKRGMAEEDICALAECGKEEVERVRKLN